VLYANTVRVFFSPSRRRAAMIANERFVARSPRSPATVELLEFPSPPGPIDVKGGRLGRSWFDAYKSGLRPSYSIVGRVRLEATPIRVALGDGSVPMVMSYGGGSFVVKIESYELRSWPDCKLSAEIPRWDVFQSHAYRDRSREREISLDGRFIASRTGRFIAELPDTFPSKQRLRLIDVEIARDVPRACFERAVWLLDRPTRPFTPFAISFSEDERELLALCLPYTDRDSFADGEPDPARLERFVANDDVLVCRWNTASGELVEGAAGTESLLESYRRELECPNIVKKPLRERVALHNWPGVKSSGQPGVINWLFWKLMMRRWQRLSRRLE
jgi:hypothetical protein